MAKNNLTLLFMLPAILLMMMAHNMQMVMRRRQNEEEGKEEDVPIQFVGRFSDYDMVWENIPPQVLQIGGGVSLLLWGFSMMTLKVWGAILLWCSGAAILHWMIPDEG